MSLYDSSKTESVAEVPMTKEELQEDLHFFQKLKDSGTTPEVFATHYDERISILKARLLIGAYTE